MVLGTHTTGRPLRQRSWEIWRLPSPPIDQVVRAVALVFLALVVPGDVAKGIAAVGRPEDGAAQVGDAADLGWPEGDDAVGRQQPFIPPLDPVGLPSPPVGRQHHGPDDGVQARRVAAAGGDGDAHVTSS
jgi:hypothetical protein